MENRVILKMKEEADGFRHIFKMINQILIDDFLEDLEITKGIDLVNPGIVNGCFACEIYLKLILKEEGKKLGNTHNLKKLFFSINGKIQNQIIKKFITKGYTEELFKRKLKYIANGFKIARYDYENNDEYYMLSGFIEDFLEILKEETES